MWARSFGLASLLLVLLSLSAAAENVRGVVRQVDPDHQELVIQTLGLGRRGLSMAFTVAPKARILIGGQPGTLSDLPPGARVRLSYEVRDGRPVALAITLPWVRGTPPAAPPSVDTITGTLARVEEAERKIVVLSSGSKEGDFSEADVSVPEEARITRNRQPIALEDLREGEQVSVFTAQRRGRLTALEIRAGKTEMRADTQVPPGDRLQLFLRLGHWVLQQMAARNPR